MKNKTLAQAMLILALSVIGLILVGMIVSTGQIPLWYLM